VYGTGGRPSPSALSHFVGEGAQATSVWASGEEPEWLPHDQYPDCQGGGNRQRRTGPELPANHDPMTGGTLPTGRGTVHALAAEDP